MSLARYEQLKADAIESSRPDEPIEVCDDCGCVTPSLEIHRVGHLRLCESCIDKNKRMLPAIKHLSAVIAMSDGGRR